MAIVLRQVSQFESGVSRTVSSAALPAMISA